MANSDNDIGSKQGTSKKIKFSKIACNFGAIGLGLGALFWVLESAIHAFLFNESTFILQLTAPTVNEIWMRLLVAFLLIGFGVFANIIVKKLSESERRMSEVLATIRLAAVMLDRDGTITYVNDYLLEITGYNRKEIIGGNWFDIFIPVEIREEIRSVHKEVLSGKLDLVGHYENQILTKSGQRRIVAWSNTVFQYSAKGDIVGSTSFGEDITEKKEAEEELERFFDFVPDMVCIGSTDGYFKKVNSQWEKVLGYSTEEILETPILDFIHPDDIEATAKVIEKQVDGEAVKLFENRYKCKDGSYKWLSWVATASKDGLLYAAAQDITERKQAEKELEESEERFRLMMEQSPSVIEFYDMEGLQINVNRAYEELWGFPASRTVNKFNLFESKEVEETGLIDYIKKAYAGQAVTVPEYEFDSSGETEAKGVGRKRWLSTRIYPLKGSNGNVNNIVIAHEDITERKQVEEKLRQSREHYALAQQAANIGSWHWDIQTDKLYWSEQIEPMFGFERGQFRKTYKAFLECVHPDDFQFVTNSVDAAVEKDTKYDIEHRIVWPDGTIRWVSGTGKITHDENGKSVHMLGIVQDITESKEAEEAAKENARLAQILLDSMPCVALLLRPKTREIIALNETAFKAGAQLGQTCFHSWAKRDEHCPFCMAPELWESGIAQDKQIEYEGVFWDAHWLPISENLYMHYAFDITESKLAEQREKQRLAELAHAARLNVMDHMASELAHELNQPLCAILTGAEGSLRAAKSLDPKNNKLLDKIETIIKQAERAGKIMSRVRNFAAKGVSTQSTVYINEVVSESLSLVRTQLKQEGVRVNLNLQDDLEPSWADPIQIEQIILNLIENSINAMKKVGRNQRTLTISTRGVEGAIEVAVKDTAGGICDEDIDKVFEPFFTTRSKGLGMGLSISRSIVEAHGGNLNFRENSSGGVTFYFTVPIESGKKQHSV